MATKDIVFEASVDVSGQGAKSLKSLKAEFKQLQAELQQTTVGTKAYQQALERLGNVKDEIGDLNQTINSLNPEGKVQAFANVAGKLAGGFQAATGAAALFGVQSEELEKQLLKVQAATALAQGIQSVTGLTDAFKVLGTVIAANPIMFLAAAIAAITAATIYWINETDEATVANEKLNRSLEQQKGLIDQIQQLGSNRIRQLKNEGATERQILEESIELNKVLFEARLKQQETTAKLMSSGDEEARKAYNSIFQSRIDAELDVQESIRALDAFDKKEKEEAAKKSEERKKNTAIQVHKEMLAERKILDEQAILAAQEQQKEFDEIFKQLELESNEGELEAYLNFEWQKMMASIDVEKKGTAMKKEIDDKAKADKDKADAEQKAAELKMEQAYISSVSDLSATYFNSQLAAARGNAAEEEKIRKKQFQADKALRVVQAVINTAKGITEAGANFPLAIAVGTSGAAQIAKILSTQYTGSTSTASTQTNTTDSPQIQTQAPNIGNPLTRLNENGQNQNFNNRVYVLESDISESQGRVAKLQEQATF